MRSLAACLLLCVPAQAQEAMTGAEFDAYTTGKTIAFRAVTNPEFGVESYLPGRRLM
ncbi:MAG: hypothetical protein ACJAUW_000764 [Yoonia sp.]|jgi:hypothetical protein